MTWNKKYLDALDQIYWNPAYIGLKSIRKRAEENEERICISKSVLRTKKSAIYTKKLNAEEYHNWLFSQEEILNHIFDITFAIAPQEVLRMCFFAPLGLTANGNIETLGREVNERYGLWKKRKHNPSRRYVCRPRIHCYG